MKLDHLEATDKLINLLKLNHKIVNVEFPFDIVYEDQVPNVCFIVISGEVNFSQKKKRIGSVPTNNIVGIKNIMDKEKSSYTYRIEKGAEIIYIDRTTIDSLCKEKNNQIGNMFNKLIKEI